MNGHAFIIIALAAAAAWSAETIAVGPVPATGGTVTPAGGNNDSQIELYWDSGTCTGDFAWYTGTNTWGGVDFSISTIAAYTYIYSSRIYYYPYWPNGTWEGNGMAVYAFSGGTPGSVMMPSRYVRGSGTVGGWQSFDVSWGLPGGVQSFVMCFSQLYNYPGVDPVYPLDSATNYGIHCWYYYQGVWAHTSSLYAGDLMLRATVDDTHSAVAPASFGRVKAMYH